MAVSQGDVWWADLHAPVGSELGDRRPVVIVQGNPFNRSRIATALCVPLTTNLRLARAAGNVLLPADASGLPHDSVANVSQLLTVDQSRLTTWVGQIAAGDIVLVPFPFTDLSGQKRRRALIVSPDSFDPENLVLCAITSRLPGRSGPGEVPIDRADVVEVTCPGRASSARASCSRCTGRSCSAGLAPFGPVSSRGCLLRCSSCFGRDRPLPSSVPGGRQRWGCSGDAALQGRS